MVYNAAVIGLGNIGFKLGFDPKIKKVYTHVEAYLKHKNFKLVGAVEKNHTTRIEFSKFHNNIPVYAKIENLLKEKHIDIISICTPPETHCDLIRYLVRKEIKFIFCEKPISMSIKEAEKTKIFIKKYNSKISINHSRRWMQIYNKAKQYIKLKKIGDLKSVSIKFTGGAFNIGTHALDIVLYLIDDPNVIKVSGYIVDKTPKTNLSNDPDISGWIAFENNVFCSVQTVGDRYTKILEIEIYGSKGTMKIYDDKVLEICKYENHPDFTNYKYPKLKVSKSNYNDDHFLNALDNFQEHLNNGSELKSSFNSAFNALKLINLMI